MTECGSAVAEICNIGASAVGRSNHAGRIIKDKEDIG